MSRLYAVLADVTILVHAAFVVFVVGGQVAIIFGWVRGWRWTRHRLFRLAHLAAIGLVVAESWLDIPCSLTVLENDLRVRAGLQPYEQTFVGRWVGRVLYYEAPAWVFTLVYTAFGATTLATFLIYPPRSRVSNSTRRQVQ